MEQKPIISIIVPTILNSFCKKTLDSIQSSINKDDIEVIIIINKKGYDKDIIPLYNFQFYEHLTESVASARNFGAKKANANFLLFIDDDMIINNKSIEHCLNFIKSNPNDCLNVNWDYPPNLYNIIKHNPFGRFLIHFGFTSSEGWAGVKFNKNQLYQTNLLASAFLLIPKTTFMLLNGYDETFKFAGFEDYDFPERLRQNNIKFFLDTRVLIYHNEENKIYLKNWMLRKVKGGETRKTAVDLGYNELKLNYNIFKKSVYRFLSFFYSTLIKLGEKLPNIKILDKLHFKYFKLLLGLSIFMGYKKLHKTK